MSNSLLPDVDTEAARQIDLWNQLANEKTFSVHLNEDLFAEFEHRDSLILDYGCGYGRALLQLKKRGFTRLIGIDPAPEMLIRARKCDPFLNLIQCHKQQIPFSNSRFDTVTLFGVLTAIASNSQQIWLIREISRILKPSGRLHISDFLLNENRRNRIRYQNYQRLSPDLNFPYGVFRLPEGLLLRHHDEEWLSRLLSPFKQLRFEERETTTMNGNRSRAFYYIGRLIG